MDSGREEDGIERGSTDSDSDPSWPSLSRDTPIISVSPDSFCPLNLPLSYSLHPAKCIVLLLPPRACLHLVDLHSCPPTAEMSGKPESLNLTPLSLIQDEQTKTVGTVEPRFIFGNG